MSVPPNRLRALRENIRLTQDEVGRALGYDYTTVSRHETSSRSLDERAIVAYAKLYKVRTFEIFIDPSDLRHLMADMAAEELELEEEDLEKEHSSREET